MAAVLSPTAPSALQQGGILQVVTSETKGSFAVKLPRERNELVGTTRGESRPHQRNSVTWEWLWYPEAGWDRGAEHHQARCSPSLY